jgi:ubiquinone/menaquinone biosynthesis C-methylase UbiE
LGRIKHIDDEIINTAAMPEKKRERDAEKYVLETGRKGEWRLNLLHEVYGRETEKLLLRIGLGPGMLVADIGCGPGTVTFFMAGQIRPGGIASGVDASAEQLSVAREEAKEKGVKNVCFIEADVYSLGLEKDSFDLVYARSLLSHLQDPLHAIMEMKRIVKPGGVLVCEDIDMGTIHSEPSTAEYERAVEIWARFGAERRTDYRVGPHMADLFRKAGFAHVQETSYQPKFISGEKKRYWEYTLYEVSPAMIRAGILSDAELSTLKNGFEKIAENEAIAVAQAAQFQVWAVKPGQSAQ